MSEKIRCKFCKKERKARSDKFALTLYSNQEVFVGSGKKRRSLGVRQVVVGHVCAVCVKEHKVRELIKKHRVKQEPGETVKAAVRRMFEDKKPKEEVKEKGLLSDKTITVDPAGKDSASVLITPKSKAQPKKGMWNRVKGIIKGKNKKRKG